MSLAGDSRLWGISPVPRTLSKIGGLLGCGSSQFQLDVDYFYPLKWGSPTAPSQCDGGQENTQKAQDRGWVLYSSDSTAWESWISALTAGDLKPTSREMPTFGDFCSFLACTQVLSQLPDLCYVGRKTQCVQCMEPHQSGWYNAAPPLLGPSTTSLLYCSVRGQWDTCNDADQNAGGGCSPPVVLP